MLGVEKLTGGSWKCVTFTMLFLEFLLIVEGIYFLPLINFTKNAQLPEVDEWILLNRFTLSFLHGELISTFVAEDYCEFIR